jgi:hypothetical protein
MEKVHISWHEELLRNTCRMLKDAKQYEGFDTASLEASCKRLEERIAFAKKKGIECFAWDEDLGYE